MKNRILKSFFSCFLVGLMVCSNTLIPIYAEETNGNITTGDEIDQDQDLVGENDNAVDDDTGGGKPSSGGGGGGNNSYSQIATTPIAGFQLADLGPNAKYVKEGAISTYVTGTKASNISAHQWTFWYHPEESKFSPDKSQTEGNYAVPIKTSTDKTTLHMTKVGYYKGLVDPIYSKITLSAKQKIYYVTEDTTNDSIGTQTYTGKYSSSKKNQPATNANNELSKYGVAIPSSINYSAIQKYGKDTVTKQLNSGFGTKSGTYTSTAPSKYTFKISNHVVSETSYSKSVQSGKITVKVTPAIWVQVERNPDSEKATYTYSYRAIITISYSNFKTVTLTNHSKTIDIANTVVATNVSASALSKYKSFQLIKKSGTNAVNTSVAKGSGGWWGSNTPAYHNEANSSTQDSNMWYYWSNSSGSGVKSVNLRNQIEKTEKLHDAQGIIIRQPLIGNLIINPNGGSHDGNTQSKTYTQQNTTNKVVNDANAPAGMVFGGWTWNNIGKWNPVTKNYIFNTSTGSLTANYVPATSGNFTLNVNPNGGVWGGKTTTQSYTQASGTNKTIKNPTRSGYAFVGWTITGDPDAQKCFSNGTTQGLYRFYANGTLTANWAKENCTVVIDPNGGEYKNSTDKTTIQGMSGTTITIANPTREGYQFMGWDIRPVNDAMCTMSGSRFTFMKGTIVLVAQWNPVIIADCVIGSNGPDGCGGLTPPGIWVHLNKDIFS